MNKVTVKLKVACQSGAVTALVCLAQPMPSFASDIELYKAPQTSEPTLMFMLDVSGSMSNSNSYDGTSETRLTRLRNGMYKLLQGDSSQGIDPLPDNLSAGLSDFDGINGRIRLEALPLGTLVDIPGTRQIYRRNEQLNQPVSCTTIATQDTTATQQRSQTRTQTKERERDRTRTRANKNKPWPDWEEKDWSKWSGWGNLVNSVASGWSNETNVGQPSQGGWVGGGACNNFTAAGSASVTSSTLEKCTAWASDNTTCTTWGAAATSQLTGTASTPVVTTGNNSSNVRTQQGTSQPVPAASLPAPSSWSTASAWQTVSAWTPASPTDTNPAPQSEIVTSSNEKSQTETQIQTQTQIQSQTQTRTAVTARNSREDTTTATRTDSRVTIYSGTATTTHRQRMIDAVRALRGGGNTPTAFAYAEVAAYMMGQTTKDLTSSGFSASDGKEAIQNGSRYIAPARVTSSKQCNKQGIYFLTDGEPVYSNNPGNYTTFMSNTLGTKSSSFGCTTNQLVSTGNSWGCIGNYAKALLDPTKNPAGVSIKTAVVGFGSDFGDGVTGNSNVENAKKWGEVGQGGWYSGASALDVVNSVKAFLKKLDQYIPPVTTGSVTIPVDALDTQNVQPWAYYPQFDPKPSDSTTGVITWFGNVKKYKTLNNSLVDRDNASITNSNGLLKDDINDFWADTSITKKIVKVVNDQEIEYTVKVGGALSQLVLGYNANATPAERRIFTDRNIAVDANDSNQNVVSAITSGDLNRIGRADFLSTSTNQFKEDPKRGYLLSLYGYSIPKDLAVNLTLNPKDTDYQTSLEQSLDASPEREWLMGAVMHSKPILLTQEGTTKYENDVLTYDNRDDLILYGTTQGVLHVVKAGKNATDTNAGKELFAFIPNEMIENQAEGLLKQASQSGTLKYGIDGQWTAYTEYVTKKGSGSTDEPVVTVKGGKQWVYGGLRMGGKSYYALDLTNVSSTDNNSVPKIKFRIDPASATSGPLSYMGQSWSKPTLGWVNWKGTRKLVMFVGGGYDMGYEADAYNQNNGIGAGVYMFDANNGDLLWWASSNATNTNGSATAQAKNVADMRYSVVSQIKTVDRNNDGLVDHLYFGDLGGQLWRTDLNNGITATDTTTSFATHAIKLLNLHDNNGSSPRFYTTPSFTIHSGGSSGLFAAVTIGSGDLSSPMSAAGSTGKDAIYVIYDKDVTKSNLYQLAESALTSIGIVKGVAGNTLASNTDGKIKTDLSRAGWYYPLNSKFRVLNDTVAIDSDLYVSIFDANQDIAASCVGGVRGQSDVHQFCLPYGQCTETVADTTSVKDHAVPLFLGKGNIGIAFGGITGDNSSNRSLVLNVPKPTGTTLPNYSGKLKFVSQRWYEKYAKAS